MRATLHDIAQWLGIPDPINSNMTVEKVSIDSRNIEKGTLFFALAGSHTDGHRFLNEVCEKGGIAVVSKDYFQGKHDQNDGFLLPVKDPLKSLQIVASQFRNRFDIPVIAITGTNGKTTVKEMTAAVLGSEYSVCKSLGSYNNHIGVPLSICAWPADCEIAILELGTNHFGEITTLCEIARPTHGVITNIGKGHLAFFKNMAGVARAKKELLDFLNKEGHAFLYGDDTLLQSMRSLVKDTTLYGFGAMNHFQGLDPMIADDGYPEMKLNGRRIKLSIPGQHNLSNALAAAAIGRALNVSWDMIHHALHSYSAYDNRMERLELAGIIILNDTYNANPSSVIKALETLWSFKQVKRRIVVLGDMMELGDVSLQEHSTIGRRVAESSADGFFSYGPEMRAADLAARESGLNNSKHYHDKEHLVDDLMGFLKTEDGILVKGSRGMHMEEIVSGLVKRLSRQ